MRTTLILGTALVASLAVAGSSLALVDAVAQAAMVAQDVANDPSTAPGYALPYAYYATGQAYGCSHLEARCFGMLPAQAQAALANPAAVPFLAASQLCAYGVLAPAAAGVELGYGATGVEMQVVVGGC